ncbi:nucleic-acid-binding protein from transposon X-element [Nephila pilipes]|uniref:Nucleic-acid-binding protein from transposon X-element n=2 Tax=Nephila pilipes TaxID=299642 RepID=A0A8X6U5Z0_NEPPI|nr:nucleic-acid-binding protein from transposon X-element [Nephila pilipes]
MESENESLQDHDMSSNASSSRASTPSIPEHFHSACLRRKLIEQELKTYTDSIDHTEILMKNLERQGLLDHPIYTNHRTMIHGLRRQRDLLSGLGLVVKSCVQKRIELKANGWIVEILFFTQHLIFISCWIQRAPETFFVLQPFDFGILDHLQSEVTSETKRSFQNAPSSIMTMDPNAMQEMPTPVSIPTIQHLVTSITHSDQCLQADAKMEGYISLIPHIQFATQEDKNSYASDLYTLQEEVRSKFNILKHEELRQETERYKDLINTWGLPEANRPQQFQLQSRRKKTTPVKSSTAKKQKITETDATECRNKFTTLAIEETTEEIEIDDEDVTPPPVKKPYAPPITIDNVTNSADLLKKLQTLTGIKLVAKLIGTSLRIYPQTPAAYHIIRRHATEANLQHFTYQLPEDKQIRVVLRGIPVDMPPEEIINDLIELGFSPTNCHILQNRKTATPMPLFLEKREERTARPNSHTTPTSYAEALKTPTDNSPQVTLPTTSTPQAHSSNITDLFQQLKDPECIEMFRILKKFIAISKSGKPTSDRFTEIMTLLQIDPINV